MMKKLLQKWYKWRAGRKLAKAINDYDAGHADGLKEGYDKGRLSFNRIAIQVTSLIMRVDRLDKQVEKLKTKGAGKEIMPL